MQTLAQYKAMKDRQVQLKNYRKTLKAELLLNEINLARALNSKNMFEIKSLTDQRNNLKSMLIDIMEQELGAA